MVPIPVDKGKAGSALADWLALPWGGPEVMAFPGYHTLAENPMKRNHRVAAGTEMFLSACGMMATGARTILLSRWRTGGQSSYDLVREFVQELPHTSPADAWQRAVLLESESRLNLDAEPRIKASPATKPQGRASVFLGRLHAPRLRRSRPTPGSRTDPGDPDRRPGQEARARRNPRPSRPQNPAKPRWAKRPRSRPKRRRKTKKSSRRNAP